MNNRHSGITAEWVEGKKQNIKELTDILLKSKIEGLQAEIQRKKQVLSDWFKLLKVTQPKNELGYFLPHEMELDRLRQELTEKYPNKGEELFERTLKGLRKKEMRLHLYFMCTEEEHLREHGTPVSF